MIVFAVASFVIIASPILWFALAWFLFVVVVVVAVRIVSVVVIGFFEIHHVRVLSQSKKQLLNVVACHCVCYCQCHLTTTER